MTRLCASLGLWFIPLLSFESNFNMIRIYRTYPLATKGKSVLESRRLYGPNSQIT